jgi:hypothetical protein
MLMEPDLNKIKIHCPKYNPHFHLKCNDCKI